VTPTVGGSTLTVDDRASSGSFTYANLAAPSRCTSHGLRARGEQSSWARRRRPEARHLIVASDHAGQRRGHQRTPAFYVNIHNAPSRRRGARPAQGGGAGPSAHARGRPGQARSAGRRGRGPAVRAGRTAEPSDMPRSLRCCSRRRSPVRVEPGREVTLGRGAGARYGCRRPGPRRHASIGWEGGRVCCATSAAPMAPSERRTRGGRATLASETASGSAASRSSTAASRKARRSRGERLAHRGVVLARRHGEPGVARRPRECPSSPCSDARDGQAERRSRRRGDGGETSCGSTRAASFTRSAKASGFDAALTIAQASTGRFDFAPATPRAQLRRLGDRGHPGSDATPRRRARASSRSARSASSRHDRAKSPSVGLRIAGDHGEAADLIARRAARRPRSERPDRS
jgi:hypothetical protein